jgi:hypothetical protein
MTLKAIKMFDYDLRRLQAGEVFEPASDADGRVLVLAQLAVEIEDEPPAKKSKKRYQRSDLRAEDDE